MRRLLSLWVVWLIFDPNTYRIATVTADPKVEAAAVAAKIPVIAWDDAKQITANLIDPNTGAGPGLPALLTVSTALTQ